MKSMEKLWIEAQSYCFPKRAMTSACLKCSRSIIATQTEALLPGSKVRDRQIVMKNGGCLAEVNSKIPFLQFKSSIAALQSPQKGGVNSGGITSNHSGLCGLVLGVSGVLSFVCYFLH